MDIIGDIIDNPHHYPNLHGHWSSHYIINISFKRVFNTR